MPQALKENQVIGVLSCLHFSSKTRLRDFLNQGGNAAVMNAPMYEVQNLDVADYTEVEQMTKSVFSLAVGAGSLLTDYRTAKGKYPNVEVVAVPSEGPRDGFLVMRVKSHNGCGVGANRSLLADFGASWQPSTYQQSTASSPWHLFP